MKYQFFWSFTPKIYELLLNLTIGIAVINYLGPTEQGKIGFLINLCMLLSFLTTLGIGPVFSNFVSRSNNNNLISGKFKDSISLRFCGYIIFLIICFLFIYIIKPNLIVLAIPFLLGKLFFSLDIYYNFVEGQGRFKDYAISKFFSLTLINGFSLYCVDQKLDVFWVAVSYFLTDFLTFFMYFILYDKLQLFGLRFNYKKSLVLLKINYKLALSTIVISLFTQLDIIIIGAVLGDREAGEFYASTRLATPLVFISAIVVSTFFSSLSKKWMQNKWEYYELLSFISGGVALIYIMIVVVTVFAGKDIFYMFFSKEYTSAFNLFLIHIASLIFVFLGPISGKHLIIQRNYAAELNKTFIASVINVVLTLIAVFVYQNLYLVALSTATGYMIANFGYFIYKKDWPFIFSLFRGMNPVFLVRYANRIL